MQLLQGGLFAVGLGFGGLDAIGRRETGEQWHAQGQPQGTALPQCRAVHALPVIAGGEIQRGPSGGAGGIDTGAGRLILRLGSLQIRAMRPRLCHQRVYILLKVLQIFCR